MKIIIPGKPIPKQRARYSKRGKHVITYDPQEADKKLVRQIMTSQITDIANSTDKIKYMQLGEICHSDVFSVQFIFFLPLNESDSVIAKNKKLWGLTRANVKPDYDNLEKFYLDCANGILWGDDSHVVLAKALKTYSEEPRVEIVIEPIPDIMIGTKIEKVITLFSPSEFKELQEHAKQISDIMLPELEEMQSGMHECWLLFIASTLNAFALKYATKLNKISKLGDIKSEAKDMQDLMYAIQE